MLSADMLPHQSTTWFNDSALVWLISLAAWRYFRLFALCYGFYIYKPAEPPDSRVEAKRTVKPKDATIIIPALDVKKNAEFDECITSCLMNHPAAIYVVTGSNNDARVAKERIERIRGDMTCGMAPSLHGLRTVVSDVETHVMCAGVANKRQQIAMAAKRVKTRIIVGVDDHVFLKPNFLHSMLYAFEDKDVGLVGTKKAVRRRSFDSGNLIQDYCDAFWNVMGILYLTRHNFEICSTNAIDGGVFVVSGRSMGVRTEIFQDPAFLEGFLNENFFFNMLGPLNPDDDNFITRWVISHPRKWKVKFQWTHEATIETSLGQYPRFLGQCMRWSRTTMRSNPRALFVERDIWTRWPWTTWISYIPLLSNFALLWDGAMMYNLTQTGFFQKSESKTAIVLAFTAWIYLTKLVKLHDYFRHHPVDFFLFFFPIPAYPLFAYFHSFLKLWSILTFYDHSWKGRKFPKLTG